MENEPIRPHQKIQHIFCFFILKPSLRDYLKGEIVDHQVKERPENMEVKVVSLDLPEIFDTMLNHVRQKLYFLML